MIRLFAVLIAAIFLCSCTVEKEEKTSMSLLNEPMNSYCVGRNVIELPKSFVLSTVITGAFKPVESELQEPVFVVFIRTQGWDH